MTAPTQNGPSSFDDFPILVISLSDAKDRQSKIEKDLSSYGLPFEFHTAVDGRKGLDETYNALVDRPKLYHNANRQVADGEIACALSHHEIYTRIVTENLAGAIILEDDAIIGDDFADFVAKGLHRDFEAVIMDYRRASVLRWSKTPVTDTVDLWRMAQSSTLTTGYSISNWAARILLQETTPVKMLADWPIDVHRIKAYASAPRLIDHPEDEVSFIEQERAKMLPAQRPKKQRFRHILKAHYWRNKIAKRIDPPRHSAS